MIYALVKDGKILKQKTFDGTPPIIAANKGEWLPINMKAKPAADNTTEVVESSLRVNKKSVTVNFQVKEKSLSDAKAHKKQEVTNAALSKVGDLPSLTDFDIYDAARDAHAEIDDLSEIEDIKNYNALTSPSWPKQKQA